MSTGRKRWGHSLVLRFPRVHCVLWWMGMDFLSLLSRTHKGTHPHTHLHTASSAIRMNKRHCKSVWRVKITFCDLSFHSDVPACIHTQIQTVPLFSCCIYRIIGYLLTLYFHAKRLSNYGKKVGLSMTTASFTFFLFSLNNTSNTDFNFQNIHKQ